MHITAGPRIGIRARACALIGCAGRMKASVGHLEPSSRLLDRTPSRTRSTPPPSFSSRRRSASVQHRDRAARPVRRDSPPRAALHHHPPEDSGDATGVAVSNCSRFMAGMVSTSRFDTAPLQQGRAGSILLSQLFEAIAEREVGNERPPVHERGSGGFVEDEAAANRKAGGAERCIQRELHSQAMLQILEADL